MKRTVLLLLAYALWYLIANGQSKADSTVVLNEVVVKSVAPQTRLHGDAIVTKIQGSVLENSGSVPAPSWQACDSILGKNKEI